jgi:hypothetical protein
MGDLSGAREERKRRDRMVKGRDRKVTMRQGGFGLRAQSYRERRAVRCSRYSFPSPEGHLTLHWVDTEFDSAMAHAPKRLRCIVVRNASLPTAAVALRSRRLERLGRRKREKVLRRAAGGVGGCKLTVEAV